MQNKPLVNLDEIKAKLTFNTLGGFIQKIMPLKTLPEFKNHA